MEQMRAGKNLGFIGFIFASQYPVSRSHGAAGAAVPAHDTRGIGRRG
jgi:hypothetical protein